MGASFESEVQQAMKIIQGLNNKQSPISAPPVKESSPGFEGEVQEAMKIIKSMNQPKEGLGFLGRAAQVGRGFLQDAAAISEMGAGKSLYAPEYTGEPERTDLPPAAEVIGQKVNELYGQDLSPTDETGKFLHGIGGFMVPMPIPGPVGAGSAAKALTKLVGRNVLAATGASAGLNLTPRMTEEGTGAGVAEDLIKSTLGAGAGLKVPSAIKTAGNIVSDPIETTQKGLAKAASRFVKPDEEMLAKAAKYDIEVPFNVGAKSTPANFLANNYLKSMYVSKQYKDALKKADSSMINAVKKSIDTLGESDIKPSAGSASFSEYLKEEEKVFKKESDALYGDARKSLKENDKVVPKNTIKALNSEAVNDLIKNLSPSESEKKVIKRIDEIKKKLTPDIVLPENINPKYIETIKKKAFKKNDVPVGELINLRKSLMNTLNYEQDVRGSEAFLSKLTRTLDEDIKRLDNKDFLKQYQDANNFFRQNIGQRFRKSMAISLTRNEAPREAYSLMNSVGNIRTLEKIAGENPKGKQIFDSLKKAKVREILGNVIEGDLSSEGTIRGGALAKLFQKGEKKQELLHKLLGDKEYKNLSEISEVSNEFAKSGRELLNTSGTAHALSDMNLAKDVSQQVMKSLAYFAGHGAAGYSAFGAVGAAVGAGAALGAPYLISRLVSNQKFVSQMRNYAIARKQGREKYADTILRRTLIPTVVHEYNTSKKEEGED